MVSSGPDKRHVQLGGVRYGGRKRSVFADVREPPAWAGEVAVVMFLPSSVCCKLVASAWYVMGTRWALAPPQGSGSLSTAATGSFTERWQLGLPGTATGAGGAAEADTWWGEGLVSYSGCLCLWVTASSGF